MSNNEKIVQAINFLIHVPNSTRLVNEITDLLEHWDTFPMRYSGDREFLNALVDVGLTDRNAFEKLLALVAAKRKLIPALKEVDYQRDYMLARRARQRRASDLYELQKGKFPNAAARKKYQDDVQTRWMTARDEFVAAKGELSWKDRNAARAEFWAGIDATLDANLAAERETLRRKRT